MSARLFRIVERLDIRPDSWVLEIGCGHGVAAGYICERLQTGRLVAIDRSDKMIAAARARNAAAAARGVAEFVKASLEAADFGARRFDRILAVRVRLFHDQPGFARRLAERWLAPGGILLAVYDQPGVAAANGCPP